VFLSSAFAEFFGIAAMVGAFLMGMGFAETKLADQLKKELSSFKNVFVAIFFISFGMMIDPAVFPKVGSLIAIAVPLTIFNELLLLALVAFLIGLTAEAAISVGAGALGRSEEAIIFANLGSTLKTSKGNSILTKSSTTLAPFAGGFCLIMSTVTPLFMKASYGIANFLKRKLPTSLKFGGFLVAKMVKGMVFSVSTVRPQKRSGVATSLVAYLILILFFICCESVYGDIRFFGIPFSLFLMIILLGMLAICIGILWFLLSLRFQAIARSLEIPNVPLNKQGKLEATSVALETRRQQQKQTM
jgi:CPA2 family monovalent cation:H+ antiporter-2